MADTGHSGGHNYSVNVPLQEGMDDESYCLVFEPVMQKARRVAALVASSCRHASSPPCAAPWQCREMLISSLDSDLTIVVLAVGPAASLARNTTLD